MANYIFSYDLNGRHPAHAEMDEHIQKSGWATGRILETVWYIGTDEPSAVVTEYLTEILSENDGFAVVTASFMEFENLLVRKDSLLAAWKQG